MGKASRDRELVRNARQRGFASAGDKKTAGLLRARAKKVNRIRRELSRSGVMDRVRGVRRVLSSEAFGDRFNAALETNEGPPITGDAQVRALIFRIVEEMGVDHGDVELAIKWEPDTKKLELWVKVKHETAQKAAASAGLFALEGAAP